MTTSTSTPIRECQICSHNKLESILFIGYIPPVNSMPDVGSIPQEEPAYPLEVLRCPKCTLVQIGLEVDPNVLFPPSYPYLSGSTKILKENFMDLYRKSLKMFDLKPTDLVIDIGSNDGTLLSGFKEGGHKVLGIEPSLASEIANKNGIQTKMTFFNETVAKEVRKEHGPARIVTAANVFAHIGDIHSVVKGIVQLISPSGVFISESHYLLGLVDTIQYDTVYHEHLRHYSVVSLAYLLEQHGLEVFHVERIPTHGGSVRVYSALKGTQKIQPSVKEIIDLENKSGLTDGRSLKTFRSRVVQSKLDLYALLSDLKKKGARIYGVGAPSRASTLINYVGLDDGIMDAVMEIKTSHKLNKYIPGTRIPVLNEDLLIEKQPEYALLLSWHIADELITNLRKRGYKGKFIVPLPEPRIID